VGGGADTSSRCLAVIAESTNNYATNLIDVYSTSDATDAAASSWNPGTANSTFELMPNATFATFNTFSGATSQYVRDYPSDGNANFGGRFKDSLDSGLNYSVNYLYHYDSNPSVSVGWYDSSTGEKLVTELRNPNTSDDNGGAYAAYDRPTGSLVSVSDIPNAFSVANSVSVLLRNSNNQYYGGDDPDPNDNITGSNGLSSNTPTLRFTETVHRIHSLGGSLDYTVDSEALPVVLRGEFLYDKDQRVPVIDRRALGVGDLEHGLVAEKADFFKYVIGADVTLLTNMLTSAQFIQFRNLDYVNESRTCTAEGSQTFDCSKYTGDAATLHLSNGLNRAKKNKEFYSLFLSKPFGPNQLGRWNNIFMFEEGGGKWNRFDVEYSFSDELIGSFELNNYWGDANTQFGQMEDSSNIQVGLKYLF
jgi:hypothetical protein